MVLDQDAQHQAVADEPYDEDDAVEGWEEDSPEGHYVVCIAGYVLMCYFFKS